MKDQGPREGVLLPARDSGRERARVREGRGEEAIDGKVKCRKGEKRLVRRVEKTEGWGKTGQGRGNEKCGVYNVKKKRMRRIREGIEVLGVRGGEGWEHVFKKRREY